MTIQETARILAIIGTVHQWVTSGDIESKVKVWWALLQDMPYDEAVRATMKVLAESEKEPKPAAIRAAAESFRTESQAVSGEIAWLEVSKKPEHLCTACRVFDAGDCRGGKKRRHTQSCW